MSVSGYTQSVRQSPPAPLGVKCGCSKAAAAGQSEGANAPPPNDEQFRLTDKDTGRPLSGVRYEIRAPSGPFTGRTDRNGFTERVHTGGRREKLEIYVVPEEASLDSSEAEWAGCVE